MATTIRELIDALEEAAEMYGDDTQILAAHQPNYPLAETISGIAVLNADDDEDNESDDIRDINTDNAVAWVVLSGHPSEYGDWKHTSPYAPRGAFGDDGEFFNV
jgi:hypothetical protein